RRPPGPGDAEERRLGHQLGAVLHHAIDLETEVVGNDEAGTADLAAFPPQQADRLSTRLNWFQPPGHLDLRGLLVLPHHNAPHSAGSVGLGSHYCTVSKRSRTTAGAAARSTTSIKPRRPPSAPAASIATCHAASAMSASSQSVWVNSSSGWSPLPASQASRFCRCSSRPASARIARPTWAPQLTMCRRAAISPARSCSSVAPSISR